jgi:hypothetical protein
MVLACLIVVVAADVPLAGGSVRSADQAGGYSKPSVPSTRLTPLGKLTMLCERVCTVDRWVIRRLDGRRL